MADDNDSYTTVLAGDYSDFLDTVVDPVVAFDPSVFAQAASPAAVSDAPAVSERDRNADTWVLGGAGAPPASAQASGAQAAPSGASATAQFVPAATAPQATSPSAHWNRVPQSRPSPSMMKAVDDPTMKANRTLIVVVIALAIVAIVAIVVALAFAFSPQEEKGQSPATPVVVPVEESSSSAATQIEPEPSGEEPEAEKEVTYKQGTGSSAIVSPGNGRVLSETEAYKALSEYYDLAADYDASLRTAAKEFNENFLKEDKAARNAKASAAATLKQKIRSSWDDLKDLELPFMSKNTQAHKDICELYECLWNRIDVIDRAWKISLTYEKPAEHESEIVAPIRANQVNGNDKYYTRFNDLYPKVNLIKP